MTSRYEPKAVEAKWQARWEKEKPWRAFNPGETGFNPKLKPFYVLDMFPYPSGSGLHVGHSSGYLGTDAVARRARMLGCNVLHPMGWDAFGLPAEQYAIQTNQHPRQTTDTNTQQYRRQLKNLGLSYDWDREIDTSQPTYYRWTQWIFLQLYKKGLVYRKEQPVWWCEELKTVLANEEVINGRSERGNYPCERRPLTQWVFKITAYAEELLKDLETLDWPESIKKQQRDWIGKSLGAQIRFSTELGPQVEVFTTRPDTLFGVSALVLAPEHALVSKLTTPARRTEVEAFVAATKTKSERDRKAEVQSFAATELGSFAVHPLSGQKIPIWIAEYVLADYGTGAVMAVPAHDERDFALAQQVGLKITPVVAPVLRAAAAGEETSAVGDLKQAFVEDGILQNSAEFSGLTSEEARTQITHKLKALGVGEARVTYKMRDWIFSRQRYWGEPFPLFLTETGDVVAVEEVDLPVELPPMQDFQPSADGSSPLARAKDWVLVKDPSSGRKLYRVTDTMPGWAGSCWYYLRFMDPRNDGEAFSSSAVEYWKQVDLYIGGASHAVMHLLYARFWHKVLYDLKIVPTREPFQKLFNQGMVTAFAFKDETGRLVMSDEVLSQAQGFVHKTTGKPVERFVTKMAKSLRNVVNPSAVTEEWGVDCFRLYSFFMGPLADEKPWADEGLVGCQKFLRRLWTYFVAETGALRSPSQESDKAWRILHKCLKRIDDSFIEFNFNTAVAGMMEALNELTGEVPEGLSAKQMEMWVKMMSPWAPHWASEIWEKLGHSNLLDHETWPLLDASRLVQSEFGLVIQVNGKVRKKRLVSVETTAPEAEKIAYEELSLTPGSAKKVIFVPKKLINLVM